jgi:predicted metal-dependent hydrolase
MSRDTSIPLVVSEGVVCTVKRSRTRRIRLSVKGDGSVVLTLPHRAPLQAGKSLIAEKRDWIMQARERMLGEPKKLLMQGSVEEYEKNKEGARRMLTERTRHFQDIYGVTYRKLSIRNQKTRFGSCSSQGHLSFNYRLIFLPEHLRDYVIVHELCHLRELNHSRKFWALVAQTIPDYKARKRDLQAFSRPLF